MIFGALYVSALILIAVSAAVFGGSIGWKCKGKEGVLPGVFLGGIGCGLLYQAFGAWQLRNEVLAALVGLLLALLVWDCRRGEVRNDFWRRFWTDDWRTFLASQRREPATDFWVLALPVCAGVHVGTLLGFVTYMRPAVLQDLEGQAAAGVPLASETVLLATLGAAYSLAAWIATFSRAVAPAPSEPSPPCIALSTLPKLQLMRKSTVPSQSWRRSTGALPGLPFFCQNGKTTLGRRTLRAGSGGSAGSGDPGVAWLSAGGWRARAHRAACGRVGGTKMFEGFPA